MKIHYFQRYHQKENVATANTMLLLSRFYQYSSDKFFRFLKTELFSDQIDGFEPELAFALQEKSVDSVPDATITQESFKIVVETKTSDWFYGSQLLNHLESFGDAKYRVLITLAPDYMAEVKKTELNRLIKEYNDAHKTHIIHKNTTFESIANAIYAITDERDVELREVVDDYLEYCYNDHLVPNYDSWKTLRVQLAGATLDFNLKMHMYYDNAERGFKPHDYLGLYSNKSVRAIGKVVARITAVENLKGGIDYHSEFGDLTQERKEKINLAMKDAEEKGWNLRHIKHRYFFVEHFYETDFKKRTPRAPMGSRVFDLTEILGLKGKSMPSTEEIAQLLRHVEWAENNTFYNKCD